MARVDNIPPRPRMARDEHAAPPEPAPEPEPTRAWSSPPGRNDILARQLAAILTIILLCTAAIPFTPVVWLLDIHGSSVFDRLFAGLALLAACYFQWTIAGLTRPLAVFVPSSSSSGGSTIRNGRIERDAPVGFVWHPSNYWPFLISEAILLGVAEFGNSELIRRCTVCGVVIGLWVVGYGAVPMSTKRWAYQNIKGWLFFMVLDELRRVGTGSVSSRRRRF
ncbi:hypothetical protein B0I35DRAFT_435425 [Stachybotrys elegans]|uniref:Uncharacterized protein n=1 Tax=Stachybotrys elegans TaxID=80388 RepID=A0A8K0WPP9_9HYPO|nr:hypothetical protein B0I35DRAFT_435425 [Stachybotrys elegans]